MNIFDPKTYENSFWDWTFLNNCFGTTGIRVSDVDGILERKGNFLLLETKMAGQEIPRGQDRLHRAFVHKGGTVLVIWGNPPCNATAMQIWYPGQENRRPVISASRIEVQDIVRRWFNWADSGPGWKGHE